MTCCKDLIEKLEYTCIRGSVDVEVSSVEMDSRKIVPGCLFICIRGANFDGHSKAAEAAEKKAASGVYLECDRYHRDEGKDDHHLSGEIHIGTCGI